MILSLYTSFEYLLFIAFAASLTTRFWFMLLGYPNPDIRKGIAGQQEVFFEDMILSWLGKYFARLKAFGSAWAFNPFKPLVCETCFNVWVCFAISYLADLQWFEYCFIAILSYSIQNLIARYADINTD